MHEQLNAYQIWKYQQDLWEVHCTLSIVFCIKRFPFDVCLLKVNNRNTRARCEICSKLTTKTPERRQWCRSGIFIVSFEHISHLVLVFLVLTLNM